MQVLFASDLHIGHALAATKRGYASIDHHDHDVIETLARQCNKRTLLWILGDVCMKMEKMPLLDSIPGKKRLVRGNHDKFNMGVYLKYFEEIHGFLRYKTFWLSHCPIHPQEMYRSELNVHGHLHKDTNSPLLPHPYYNVNWDYWRKAISLEKIRNDLENYKKSNQNTGWYYTP